MCPYHSRIRGSHCVTKWKYAVKLCEVSGVCICNCASQSQKPLISDHRLAMLTLNQVVHTDVGK